MIHFIEIYEFMFAENLRKSINGIAAAVAARRAKPFGLIVLCSLFRNFATLTNSQSKTNQSNRTGGSATSAPPVPSP